ncbi:hypothetical protein DFH09DRAFT_1194257 [Mycena vulgaris]|nr:hypothetical protein DFH09DRAFT_1194257 [Mycena vulgaris]
MRRAVACALVLFMGAGRGVEGVHTLDVVRLPFGRQRRWLARGEGDATPRSRAKGTVEAVRRGDCASRSTLRGDCGSCASGGRRTCQWAELARARVKGGANREWRECMGCRARGDGGICSCASGGRWEWRMRGREWRMRVVLPPRMVSGSVLLVVRAGS